MDGPCNILVFVFVWLLTLSNVVLCIRGASCEVECIPSERDALLKIKHHLSDPSNRLTSWSPNGNCCNWAFVICHNITGHVLELHLTTPPPSKLHYMVFNETLSFGGEIHSSLLGLKHLNYLDLSNNDFGGMKIPTFLGSITSLTYLNLSNAVFGGNIPHQIAKLSNLQYLDLGGNEFSGSIPHQIGKLFNLQYLDLRGNEFSGSIPHQIGNLSNLQYLDLGDNQFSGSIPHQIGNLSNLINLHLRYRFAIPIENLQWVSALSSLQYLELSYANLSNTFDWLQVLHALPSLRELHLLEYWSFQNLIELDLSDNSIQGLIPNSLGNLASLKYLDLSSNSIKGALPSSLGNLKSLVYLSLWNNTINSAIPISFGNLTSLMHLVLTRNQLDGNPFEILGSLSKLNYLGLGYNLFQGVVKEAHFVNLTHLQTFWAPKNQLTLKVDPNWNPSFLLLEELSLDSWNLGPQFPSWVQSLEHLWYLDISSAMICDSIPTSFWSKMGNLQYLNISYNHIEGELSTILINTTFGGAVDLSSNKLYGQLPCVSQNVMYIDLSSNWFLGSITHFLCHRQEETKSLQFLKLASNNLSGNLPDCWMSWPYLTTVNLANNHLSGMLNTSMASLLELQMLNLRNNNFSGKFPSFLMNGSNMICLDLGDNQFSGILPSWVGQRLSSLKILVLRSNHFSGPIPHQICDMNFLQILDLAHNKLIGYIPKCVEHLHAMSVINSSLESYIYSAQQIDGIYFTLFVEALLVKGRVYDYSTNLGLVTSIDFSSNKLSGEIPIELSSLKGLHFLNLSNNHFIGQIPQKIGYMESLESMDLSRNLLSGKIPASISQLSFLSFLNLSYNNLMGKIPTGTQLQSFEASSFIGNDLCGPPLNSNCPSNSPNNDKDKEVHHGNGIHWFFVSMALGFIVGFWVVVGPLLYSATATAASPPPAKKDAGTGGGEIVNAFAGKVVNRKVAVDLDCVLEPFESIGVGGDSASG
ncbi:receptor-like protein EIX2 [Neltuma alba]|uniref:receptor-like protein EIX2 n=1 Tax=Neltuma alba TaxID=207710 RepID=UPI0010A3D32B|nr:receptor-like protein EIX2 [Prosopis alba]